MRVTIVEPGDPARAAEARLQIVDSPDPPGRIVLGSDAVERVGKVLRARLDEYGRWEAVARSTDQAADEP